MRPSLFVSSVAVLSVIAVFACSSSSSNDPGPPGPDVGEPVRDSGASSTSSSGGNTTDGGGGADADADGPELPKVPAVQYVGRFDTTNPLAPKTAWPGARILARFNGTGAKAKLTHIDGPEGGNTWMNVVVDGALKAPIEVTTTTTDFTLATGLAVGDHVVEVQKRTEPNVGTVVFEGFTFEGGTGLLPPPPPATRRIEFLSDSTVDGYGVDGDYATTCGDAGAPVQFNDARKSIAFLTGASLSAGVHLIAYSGKGIARNEDGTTTELFASVFPKTLPDEPTSPWPFASWIPDVVVISLGGSDFATTGTAPGGLQAGYASLLADIRAKHGAGPRVVFLVWSQFKDYDAVTVRTDITAAIDGAIAGDAKASRFTLPEANLDTDETGCQQHANAAHHQAMSTLLVTELKSKLGW